MVLKTHALRATPDPLPDGIQLPGTPLMLDLCAGLGGASAAMIDRGWSVVSVDNEPLTHPTYLGDIRDFSWHGDRPLLVWASPPCTEFAKAAMPWYPRDLDADMSIFRACERIIRETDPVYWIIENVRGAVLYFGPPAQVFFPWYLWGHFPHLSDFPLEARPKSTRTSGARDQRARIPYQLSLAVCLAVERQLPFDTLEPTAGVRHDISEVS